MHIAERVLTHAAINDPAFFVVGWTWIDRFDYTKDQTNRWSSLMPIDDSETAKVYYRDLHSEFRDKFASLSLIKLTIDTLNQKRIPFLMTYMDDLIFDSQWHSSPAITDMQQCIRPYLHNWNGMNFVEWAKKQGYPISKTMHPLEDAHAAAAELMTNHILV